MRVEIDGVEVANTTKPKFLFETMLYPRTYIPKTDCRLDLLLPSDLTTECPYKVCGSSELDQLTNSQVDALVIGGG